MDTYKVEITTLCDYTVTADDAVVAGQGVAAYYALKGRHDVEIVSADGLTIEFIPFKAVCHAKVTITKGEGGEVVDDVCNETTEETPTTPDEP